MTITIEKEAREPMDKPLTEQFAGLPVDVQSRLFRVLDLIVGMDEQEKRRAFFNLGALGSPQGIEALTDSERQVFLAVQALVLQGHIEAGGTGADFLEEEE